MRGIRFVGFAAQLLSLILIISCARTKTETLKIGYIPIADCSQLFVAQEEGFFTEEGVTVELIPMAGGARILEALGANSVDIGFSNVVSLILAKDASLPYSSIFGGPIQDSSSPEHAILVNASAGIATVTDLSGKRIAVNTVKNIDELMVRSLLNKYQVDTGTVSFIEIPFPRMIKVLQRGDVDAIAAIEPFVTFGLDDTAIRKLCFNYLEIQDTTEISTFVAEIQWIKNNEELVQRFRKALKKATVLANSDRQTVVSALTKYTKLSYSDLERVVLPRFKQSLDKQKLSEMILRVKNEGWISSQVSPDSLIWDFE